MAFCMNDKLVYIGSNLPDKTPAAVRVFANALALRGYGFDVKIISKDKEFKSDFDQNEGIDTWHLHAPHSTKEWIRALVNARPYTNIIEIIGDVKVVVAYELPSVVFLKLWNYCKSKGIKLICETAEWQRWENLGNLGLVARTVRLMDINLNMHYAYKKGNGVIVSSHYFAKHFKDDLPVLSLPTLQCHRLNIENNHVNNHPRKFIYAGGLGYQKDMLSEIIHAFGDVANHDFEFNIFGLTKEQYAERFEKDIPIIDIINQSKEKIKFRGKVSHGVVLNELMQSDFSLIIRQSSHRNNMGFPTKFGESINCGTPVIVSDFSDVVYYTKMYDVGIVTNVNNIAEGIRIALEMDDNALQQMHQRCKECKAFYYEGHIREIGDFAKSVLNS